MNSFFSLIPGATEYSSLQDEKSTLTGSDDFTELQHYLDYKTRLAAIVSSPQSVSAELRNYLLTEGGIEAMEGIPLGPIHMLYWLDLKLKAKLRDTHSSYTSRLSEAGAGWGDAAPTTLTGADPLGLVATLEAFANPVRAAIIDGDAADDTTASSRDGAVRITRDTQACTTIGGTPKTYNDGGGASASLRTSTQTYRYRLWSSVGNDLHEDNGSADSHFPLSATAEAIILIRNTVTDQIVNENRIGVANTQQQCARITIRGYPGEWPELHCGNSTDSDVTPTTVAAATPTTPYAFSHGVSATFYRDNVHWRNIWFHGKRETAGGEFIFTQRILYFAGTGSGHSVRHCQFTDCQPMRPDESPATPAGYVDLAFSARGVSPSFAAVYCLSTDFVFDSNYIKPADDDFPLPLDSESGVLGFTTTWEGTNQRVTRNRYEGRSLRSPIRLLGPTGCYVANNYIDSANYKYIFVTDASVDTTIERNFCRRNGTIAGQAGEGIDCGEGSTNTIVRHNVCWTPETIIDGSAGISVSEDNGETTRITSNISVYGNIVHGPGINFGYSSSWDDADVARNQFQNVVIENNVVHGYPAANPAYRAAPIRVKLAATTTGSPNPAGSGSMQTVLGNAIRNNNLTGGVNAIAVRTDSTQADLYAADGVLDGFTGNTAVTPTFADAANGDLRITNDGPWSDWFPSSMPFSPALSQAWTPD